METFVPSSTNIDRATYEEATKELRVVFKSGEEYSYTNVPRDVWFGLQHASSAGRYHQSHIKDRYPYEQV